MLGAAVDGHHRGRPLDQVAEPGPLGLELRQQPLPFFLRPVLLGDLLGHHVHAYDLAVRAPERVPALEPDPLDPRLPGRLAPHHHVPHRLAALHDRAQERLGLLGQVRHHLRHAPADVVGGRHAVDLRQPLVDAAEPKVPVDHAQAHGRGAVGGLELGQAPGRRGGEVGAVAGNLLRYVLDEPHQPPGSGRATIAAEPGLPDHRTQRISSPRRMRLRMT